MSEVDASASVARVRAALRAAGHEDSIVAAPAGARTAAEAAAAIGCTVAQIVKSLIFKVEEKPALVLASGANRVDTGKLAALLGAAVGRADAAFVRAHTGFAIGGVAPLGHLIAPMTLCDADLLALDPLWAAAGSPHFVFRTSAEALCRITGARVAVLREG